MDWWWDAPEYGIHSAYTRVLLVEERKPEIILLLLFRLSMPHSPLLHYDMARRDGEGIGYKRGML